jgi:hypothetical protein
MFESLLHIKMAPGRGAALLLIGGPIQETAGSGDENREDCLPTAGKAR